MSGTRETPERRRSPMLYAAHEYVLIALKGSAITIRSIKVFVNNPPPA